MSDVYYDKIRSRQNGNAHQRTNSTDNSMADYKKAEEHYQNVMSSLSEYKEVLKTASIDASKQYHKINYDTPEPNINFRL